MSTIYIHTNYGDYEAKVAKQEGTNTNYIDLQVDGTNITLFMELEQMEELGKMIAKHVRKEKR